MKVFKKLRRKGKEVKSAIEAVRVATAMKISVVRRGAPNVAEVGLVSKVKNRLPPNPVKVSVTMPE